jgi:hypothetical protein
MDDDHKQPADDAAAPVPKKHDGAKAPETENIEDDGEPLGGNFA